VKKSQLILPALSVLLAFSTQVRASLLSNPTPIPGLARLYAATVDSTHNLYVTDTDNHTIDKYNAAHAYLGSLAASSLSFPLGITHAPNNHFYVVDSGKVKDFDTSFNLLNSFTAPGVGITADPSSNVFVAGGFNVDTVTKFSPTGSTLLTLTSANGINLFHPLGVTLDPAGNIVVADSGNRRIVTYSPTGTFLSSFDIPNPFVWSDRTPKEVQVATDGTYFVTVGDNGFAAFTSTGILLDSYQGPSAFGFDGASGIALDGNTLYGVIRGIATPSNAQILVFAVPEPTSLLLVLPALLLLRRRPA